MKRQSVGNQILRFGTLLLPLAALFLVQGQAYGQARQNAPVDAKTSAPIDLTGYWVSVITQNWRLRMVTPPKGDYIGIPMTVESKKIADAWDPAKEEAAGNQCKGYGAAAIMIMPERLHITWHDLNTMQMDIDSGTQTRFFHFGDWKPSEIKPSWQGDSVAQWTARRGPGTQPNTKAKYLEVTTTHMLPGFLRRNGVPYSEKAALTEYYDVFQEPDGEQWFIVTIVVEDPLYLDYPLILNGQFKKQTDSSGWDPTPCSARW
jgi:hypothetical protein